MEMLSFVGIILGLVCFIFLSMKRVNLFLGTLVATVIVAVFSQMNVLTALSDTYMSGFTSFIKQYLLLFFGSAIFGKCVEDSGCARKAGLALMKVAAVLGRGDAKRTKFTTIIMLTIIYFFMAFSGINGFVLVFTLLAIGREMFHDLDIPWYLYPYGSGGIAPAALCASSLYMSNIMFADGFGVEITSEAGLSIVAVIVSMAVLYIMLYLELRKVEKKNDRFLPTGQGVMTVKMETVPDDKLPNIVITIICIATPVASILLFDLTPFLGLFLGAGVTVVLNFKRFKALKTTLATGVVSAASPIINTCGAVGLAAVLKAASGFNVIISGIDILPPLYGAILLNLIFAGGIGSATSHIPIILPTLVDKMAQAGISNGLAHRLCSMSVFTYMVPHNSGPVNGMTLCRYEKIGKPAWIYFKTTFIPGLVAMVVALVLVELGVVS